MSPWYRLLFGCQVHWGSAGTGMLDRTTNRSFPDGVVESGTDWSSAGSRISPLEGGVLGGWGTFLGWGFVWRDLNHWNQKVDRRLWQCSLFFSFSVWWGRFWYGKIMEDLQGVILTKTCATYADILAGSDLGVCPTRSFAPKNCKFARHKRS